MVLPGMGLEPMACLVGGLSSNTLGWVARYDTTALSNKISTVGAGYQPARYAAMIVEGFRAGYYPAPYGFNGGNTIILHFGENQILDRKMLSPFSLSQ